MTVMASSSRHSDIGRRFAQAAATYDGAAVLQRGIAESLLAQTQQRLPSPSSNERWIDVGCGTGYLTQRLARQRAPQAGPLCGIDIAHPMLLKARSSRSNAIQWLQADAARLPFSTGSVDRLYSSLALQWLDDLGLFLEEAYRCLRPGGWLSFSTLGDDTLRELRQLQQQVSGRPHPSSFMSVERLYETLHHCALQLSHHRRQSFCCHYADVIQLMRGLSQLGAQGPASSRRGLKGRTWLRQLTAASDNVREPQGIPARYDTHFVILHKPR
ncbi:methyltransferase [Zymobacter palmae]|uniref:Malonyl-[acyl-carrier protein] O-methyltransferase n=1 Tax=Zymobacter palmae TaxID=33074 RepID=A0A348HEU0_9GAMM|nr:methyltransferase [Zymobacter palmae]BBG30142.1 SAM-dependent methyltransferases [Zymobacter palmae]